MNTPEKDLKQVKLDIEGLTHQRDFAISEVRQMNIKLEALEKLKKALEQKHKEVPIHPGGVYEYTGGDKNFFGKYYMLTFAYQVEYWDPTYYTLVNLQSGAHYTRPEEKEDLERILHENFTIVTPQGINKKVADYLVREDLK